MLVLSSLFDVEKSLECCWDDGMFCCAFNCGGGGKEGGAYCCWSTETSCVARAEYGGGAGMISSLCVDPILNEMFFNEGTRKCG